MSFSFESGIEKADDIEASASRLFYIFPLYLVKNTSIRFYLLFHFSFPQPSTQQYFRINSTTCSASTF